METHRKSNTNRSGGGFLHSEIIKIENKNKDLHEGL